MVSLWVELDVEPVPPAFACERISTKIQGPSEIPNEVRIAAGITGNRRSVLVNAVTETRAPQMRPCGIKLGDEDIAPAAAFEASAVEIYRTLEGPCQNDVTVGIYGDVQASGRLFHGVPEPTAPDVRTESVELGDENIRRTGADQRPVAEVHNAFKVPGEDDIVRRIEGHVGHHLIRTPNFAEPFAPHMDWVIGLNRLTEESDEKKEEKNVPRGHGKPLSLEPPKLDTEVLGELYTNSVAAPITKLRYAVSI
jgi:hypothetical protein